MTKTSIQIIVISSQNAAPPPSTATRSAHKKRETVVASKPEKLQKQVEQALQNLAATRGMSICVFDLDGTITPSNTITLLVEKALSQHPLRLLLYRTVLKKILYIAHQIQKKLKTKTDVQKHVLALALKGLTKEEVDRAAKAAALQAIKETKQTDAKHILALMKTLQAQHSVLILSKTLDPLAPHIRSLFNAPTITSKLKYRGEKIAGLKREIDKTRYIQALTRLGYKPLITVTDTPQELYPQFPVKIYIVAEEKRQRTSRQTSST